MRTFHDEAGNEWTLTVNVTGIQQVRADTEFAFGTCLNDGMDKWLSMLNDLELFPRVLYSLLKKQVEEAGLSKDTFLNNICGDTAERAQEALWEAFAFFCPPHQREMLNKLQVNLLQLNKLELETMDKNLKTFIQRQSASPLSPESIPDLLAYET